MNRGATTGAPSALPTACRQCGSPLAAGSAFCDRCGEAATPAALCRACGTDVPASARYCDNCGQPTATAGGRRRRSLLAGASLLVAGAALVAVFLTAGAPSSQVRAPTGNEVLVQLRGGGDIDEVLRRSNVNGQVTRLGRDADAYRVVVAGVEPERAAGELRADPAVVRTIAPITTTVSAP